MRRLDHLRTCGGKDHLKKLQGLIPENEHLRIGQSDSNLALARDGNNTPALKTLEEELAENHKDYENREYGLQMLLRMYVSFFPSSITPL